MENVLRGNNLQISLTDNIDTITSCCETTSFCKDNNPSYQVYVVLPT